MPMPVTFGNGRVDVKVRYGAVPSTRATDMSITARLSNGMSSWTGEHMFLLVKVGMY